MKSLEEVKKENPFKETNSALLYKSNDSVYKIIKRNTRFYDEIIENILNNYVLHHGVNPHIILPTELVSDNKGNIRGYRCKYVPGNNLQCFAKELSTSQKIMLLNDLLVLLKEINKYLIVGDINLANCMYDNLGNTYMIDFDLSIPFREKPSRFALYNFIQKKSHKSVESNLSTDKLKMAILCASVLYETDFESSFVSNLPYNKWDKFYQYTENEYFKNYFKKAFKCINHNQELKDYLYLPENADFTNLIDKDKQRIRGLY